MSRELGWKRDNKRGMVFDKTGRFRVFRVQNREGGTRYYILEDRREGQCCMFDTEDQAVRHAEEVKGIDAKCRWLAERKRKINAEVEFRHVSSSGGFYYWKNAEKRRSEREKKWKD